MLGFDKEVRHLVRGMPPSPKKLIPEKHGKQSFTVKDGEGCAISVSLSQQYLRVERCHDKDHFGKLTRKSISFKWSAPVEVWAEIKEMGLWAERASE